MSSNDDVDVRTTGCNFSIPFQATVTQRDQDFNSLGFEDFCFFAVNETITNSSTIFKQTWRFSNLLDGDDLVDEVHGIGCGELLGLRRQITNDSNLDSVLDEHRGWEQRFCLLHRWRLRKIQVGRQHREFHFIQERDDSFNPVVELMIAERLFEMNSG